MSHVTCVKVAQKEQETSQPKKEEGAEEETPIVLDGKEV